MLTDDSVTMAEGLPAKRAASPSNGVEEVSSESKRQRTDLKTSDIGTTNIGEDLQTASFTQPEIVQLGNAQPTSVAEPTGISGLIRPDYQQDPRPVSKLGLQPKAPDLPPSLELVGGIKRDLTARGGFVGEEEVGIIGYAGPSDVKGIKAVIKQR